MGERPEPTVVESYRGYSPALDVRALTESLLGEVPPQFFAGLREVVLTNAGGLSHDRRRARTWSRGRTPVADDWARRLVRARIRRQYPWLYHPLDVLTRLARVLAATVRWAGRPLGGARRRPG